MKAKHSKMGFLLLSVIAVVAILAATALADLRDTIDKSFTVAPGGWLNLETDNGYIEVKTSPQPQVKVLVDLHADTSSDRKARKVLDKFTIDMAQSENEIRIEAKFDSDDDSFWDRDRKRLKVRYTIKVPQQ